MMTIYDLFDAGWTARPVSLYDEEGVEGWRWEDASGTERDTVVGDWGREPPLPTCEIDDVSNQ